uniref:Uncharacterized protein n=1 Tax=Oryza meridionalis TaxID=40149 RepID=A0A0E0CKJ7_9ORYZ
MAQVADTVALHPWLLDLLPLLIVLLISTHVLVLVHTSPSRESLRPPSGSSVLVPCPSGAPSVQGQTFRELCRSKPPTYSGEVWSEDDEF